jgi:hypothetical protein
MANIWLMVDYATAGKHYVMHSMGAWRLPQRGWSTILSLGSAFGVPFHCFPAKICPVAVAGCLVTWMHAVSTSQL